MSTSVDLDHALLEIEHALSKRFPHPSTAITHALLSNGVWSVQISWVVTEAPMNILDARCMLHVVLAPPVLERYARLGSAARLRFREALCEQVTDKVHCDVPAEGSEIVECNLTVDVRASMLDDVQR